VIIKNKRTQLKLKRKTLWVKKKFFDLIVSGKKILEVRVLYPNLKTIQKGDLVNLNNRAILQVKDIRIYPNFEAALLYEEASQIFPGKNQQEILKLLKSLYPPSKEKLGVLVLEIEAIKKNNKKIFT
jgi:ASC-1-like (ASCH) protein